MGLKMRHDAIKVVLARAFKQAGFQVKMEQDGWLKDRRRPGDVEVEAWLVVNNWTTNTSLSIDVAVIDSTGDSHAGELRKGGVGAAATKYQKRKTKTYSDIKGMFIPFIIEAQGGFGIEAKKLVRELERRRRERQCLPNTRGTDSFQPLGKIDLVTAIGFELVRRNARMIIDRSPEDEPLIPSERTKIRLEVMRKKREVEQYYKKPSDHYSYNAEPIAEEPLGSKVLESCSAHEDRVSRKQKKQVAEHPVTAANDTNRKITWDPGDWVRKEEQKTMLSSIEEADNVTNLPECRTDITVTSPRGM